MKADLPHNIRAGGGFTLVELLVVIAVIGILAGLVLSTSGYVQQKAAHSRAQSEIAAMESALESYWADNGTYPDGDTNLVLYKALTGDTVPEGNETGYGAGGKAYMEIKPNMLNGQTGIGVRIIDPWGDEYKFESPGDAARNPAAFDLWSDAGDRNTPAKWITNW